MFGYGFFDTQQTSSITTSTPGSLNPVDTSTAFAQLDENEFSPLGEIGFSVGRALNAQTNIRIGYAGYYVGVIRNAEETINWSLPNMGIRNTPGTDSYTDTLYASIDFRR